MASFAVAQQDWAYTPPSQTRAPQLNAPQSSGPFQQPINVATAPQQPEASHITVATPEPATASESESSPEDELASVAKEKMAEAQYLFSRALKGDRDAIKALAFQFLTPVAIFIAALVVASWIGGYLGRMVDSIVSSKVDITLGRFAGKLMKFCVMAIPVLWLLGPYMTAVAGVLAGLVFAIGMALQGTLGNFAAGIALLFFRPFKVGDYIKVDGEQGTVKAIELFTTTVDTPDNRHIIIPNDSIFGNKMENWSHNPERRVDVLVGVSYSADMKQTRQVLLNAIQNIEGTVSTRGSQVYLCELNASSVDWSCRVWAKPENFLAVKERVTEAVKNALDAQGIGIPFPQLDLHVITAAQQKLAA